MIFPGLGQLSYKKFIQITLAAALPGAAWCCLDNNHNKCWSADRTESHTFAWKAISIKS